MLGDGAKSFRLIGRHRIDRDQLGEETFGLALDPELGFARRRRRGEQRTCEDQQDNGG